MTPKRPDDVSADNFSMTVRAWPVAMPTRRLVKGLGNKAVQLIQKRLRGGHQGDGSRLPAYSDAYLDDLRRAGAGTRRDLQLSGSLVKNIRRLSVTRTAATVGWKSSSRSPNVMRLRGHLMQGSGSGQRHHDIVRRLSKGTANTEGRQILGVTKADKSRLSKWLKARSRQLISKK